MRRAVSSASPTTTGRQRLRSFRRPAALLLSAALAGTVSVGAVAPAQAADAVTTTTTAVDGFDRSVTTGWGTAERGGPWTTTTSASAAHVTVPGAGRQQIRTPGWTGWADLTGFSSTSADVRLDVALDKAATGGGTYVSVVGRKVTGAGDYRARLRVQSSGAVTLIAARGETTLQSATLAGVTYTAGTALTVRLQVTGTYPTTVRAKAWKAGTTEPSAWLVSATDSTATLQKAGSLATSTYLSGSATNAPVTTSFSRVSAKPVGSNLPPTAALAVSAKDLTATASAAGSVDPDGSVASYAWTFGDGATATGATATHTYAAAGTYTVGLTVTDNAGARTTKTATVTVTRPNLAPVARATVTTADLTASFDGTPSSDPDGHVAAYAWSFGDGTTGTGSAPRRTYATAGTYTVTLTVTDNAGARSTTSLPVTVHAPQPVLPAPGAVKPGPTNTGVPAGTALRVHTGDLIITTPGAVVDALDIHGLVVVKAPDVTIKRSIIRGRPITGSNALIMNGYGTYRFTLEDSELAPAHPSPYINGIIGANFTVRRTNIHHVIDQIHITGDDVTVESSWLHDNLHYTDDPNHSNGSHDDNVQVQGGRNIRLVGNTMSGSYNAALQITQDRAAVADLTYAKNWADNGGCTLNIAEKTRGPMSGLVVTDNTFTRTSRFNCTILYPPTSPITFARNLHSDGSAITMIAR